MRKVFGVGWAKTGTTTLGTCLRRLGYRHLTTRLDLVGDLGRGGVASILAIAADHDSAEDWPWLLLYQQLDETFPGARFVLTTRQSDAWLSSYRNMLDNQGEASAEMNEIRRILYGLPFPHVTDGQLLDRYQAHNTAVRDWFAGRPEALLVVDWSDGDGWDELCGFLGQTIPDLRFPHANRGVYRTG